MSKETGGSAFPFLPSLYKIGVDGHIEAISEGLTIRDWFAGMALQGIVSTSLFKEDGTITCPAQSNAAEWVYRMADAMLEEREK